MREKRHDYYIRYVFDSDVHLIATDTSSSKPDPGVKPDPEVKPKPETKPEPTPHPANKALSPLRRALLAEKFPPHGNELLSNCCPHAINAPRDRRGGLC